MNVNNLTTLMEIDEENIIQILKTRYNNDIIYTNIDDILIAINPYKNLPIYNYNNFNSPHVYTIAQKAIENLKTSNNNQTILISGDSGSGKTMSTKFIINYFAHHFSTDENLCHQIINANPIIEMFGNAETSINDNSSRFGKFIKVYFDDNITEISGIQIDTYLLEKSRVCYQNNTDFNFHIFNQVAIHNNKIYKYCSNPKSSQTLEKTIDMMVKFGFKIEEVNDIIKIINLILQIGDSHKDENWTKYINLIGFEKLIFTRVLNVGIEKIIKNLHGEELEKNKFTMATQLYEICFKYIIDKINMILNPNSIHNKFIGLLDIFGFEIFENNNFEQLCINYTNEKLQNHHNYIIFQHEQELYKKEEIDWTIVKYKDNSEILNIFENKYGLINLLDEECTLVHSSDNNFHQKMKNFIKSTHLTMDINPEFIIQHYAGNVKYSCENFCEKNKQKITKDLLNFLSNSNNTIFSNFNIKSHREKSIIKSFSKELTLLMNKIKNTNNLFIKCIKPNNNKISDNYQNPLIHTQLLFSGIFETIQISRANYPIRYPIMEYYKKYDCVMNEFNTINFTKKDIQFGNSIVFMRTETFMHLEKVLLDFKIKCSIIIQKNWKRYVVQKYYKQLKKSTIKIQSIIRMFLEKRRYHIKRNKIIKIQTYFRMIKERRKYVKMKNASIKIQAFFRMYSTKHKFINLKKSTIKIQSHIRRFLIRRKFLKLKSQVLFFQHLWKQKKQREQERYQEIKLKPPKVFWPKSSNDSPSIFYVTSNDLVIEDEEILSPALTESDEQEIKLIKIQYESKILSLQKKYKKEKISKQEIKEKFKSKLLESHVNNQILSDSLSNTEYTNKLLVERLNNLLVANYQLQRKFETEKKKGVINKLYEFLFT